MNHEYDPNLVFVGFPVYGDAIPRATRQLMNLFAGDIGPFTFIPFDCVCFSAAKARNIITAAARKTKAGKILMVDADMNAGEAQILRILQRPEQIIGGIYPKKELRDDPIWVAWFQGEADKDGVVPGYCGGGWMKIERQAIEKIIKDCPERRYLSDDDVTRGETQFQLFAEEVTTREWGTTGIWPRSLGEDFAFCELAQRCGIPTFVDSHCQIGHIGPVDFLQVYAMLDRIRAEAVPGPHGSEAPVLPLHT